MNVKVYYNEVTTTYPFVVHPNCPNVNLPIEDAIRIAEDRVKAGDWFKYLIPELMSEEVIFEN